MVSTEPVAMGETALFTATVEGAAPTELSYQWRYSTDGGQTWRNLGWASAKSPTLEAAATSARVGHQWYCCVVTASDGRTATSDAVTFEIA